jgi:putative ABC transport system permease protein
VVRLIFVSLLDDVREALRRIRRNPRTSLLATGTLALGIGAATAVFTLFHSALVAPPPYRDPDRIVSLIGHRGENHYVNVSPPDFLDYVREPGLFECGALTNYAEFNWTGQSLPGFDGAEVLRGLWTSADYFRVFDQPLAAGRGFAAGEENVAVISHGLWQRRFAGRSEVVGQSITLNGEPHTVVGVAGPRFLSYEPYEVAVWVPQPLDASDQWRDSRGYTASLRLRAGVTVPQAQQRMDALTLRLAEAHPATNRGYSVRVEPLMDQFHREARPMLMALAGAVICLLLIAAANVASLLLARATTQSRELAIRAALGAGRLRLYRMVLAESIVLALAASGGGAVLGAWLLAAGKALLPPQMQYGWLFAIDVRVFLAAFLVSAAAGVIAGLAPAFESFRLAAGGLRPHFGRNRLLRGIVTAEIALATVLSIGAGLLGKSFIGLVNRPLGYDTDQLLGMRVRLIGERYKGIDRKAAYWAELVERAGALPGIARAACVSDLPMGWQYMGSGIQVAGQKANAHYIEASPGYFGTVGIPLLAGRGFTDADHSLAEPVVIVNDLLAATYWPGQSAIGRQLKADKWRTVVGVVRRIRHGGPEDRYRNEIYLPYRQANVGTMFLVVRTLGAPESAVPAILATLKSIDPDVPAFEIRSMRKAFEREIAMPRLPMVFTVVFAALAAALAALGLFGVVGYWVSQRTREMGIRAAMGARAEQLRSLVLRQGAVMAAIGLAIGLGASLAVMRLARSLLYGMSERDLLVYCGAAALALVSTLAACWVPARRAARTEPAAALRME